MKHFPPNKSLCLAALALLTLTARPAAAITYSVIDLGALPTGTGAAGFAVNNLGQVTGGGDLSNGATHGIIFTNGVLKDIGVLPGGDTSVGQGINNLGQVTGNATIGNGAEHVILYRNGVLTDLGTLGGPTGFGKGINDAGQIAGFSDIPAGAKHAFLYSGGVMNDLGTLPGGTISNGNAINKNGHVAGFSRIPGAFSHAVLFANGAITDLGVLPGGTSSTAASLNDRDQAVGTSEIAGGGTNVHACLFSGGAITDLGVLPGDTFSIGRGINNLGQMVGISGVTSTTTSAFLYINGRIIDLNTLISPASHAVWALQNCYGINDRGQITGYGMHNGALHGYLLSPATRFDFNLDGYADIVFQSQSNGSVPYETLSGVTLGSFGYLFGGVAGDYKVVATPDLNGDGKPDVIFQSPSTNKVTYGFMNGLTPTGVYGFLFPNPLPTGYRVAGTPDLNGDGNPDILFQNQASGDIAYTFLNGVTLGASGYLFRGLDPNQKLVGTPDLNGDGHPDLLFENMKTGDVTYALMNGTTTLTPTSYGTLFRGIPLEYQIVGTPDLNGDGFEDIVFQGQTNGDVSYVFLNNLSVTGSGYLFRHISLDFKIVGIH